MQVDSNEIQPRIQRPSRSQRLKLRTSCDPCAASKVRCTKEQHGCSRCAQNSLKCVYGRSQRKGKPPSNKSATAKPPPSSSPRFPTPSPWPDKQEPVHHYPNPHLNTNCIWYRSKMLQKTSSENQESDNTMATEGKRSTSINLNPHQWLPNDDTTPQTSISSEHIPWPNLLNVDPSIYRSAGSEDHIHLDYDEMNGVDEADDNDERDKELEREYPNKDQHEPCIKVACRVLSSLYEFVRCDCVNNSSSSSQCKDPALAKEGPGSDIVFCVTRSAMKTVSQLLNCTGIICAQDASILLVLGAILCKIFAWYQTLYQAEIAGLFSDRAQDASPSTSIDPAHHLSDGTDFRSKGSRQVEGNSMYTVPLAIPLSTGSLNLPRATERKIKAQFLLCQVQTLLQMCQRLDRRAQTADSEGPGREKSLLAGSNAQLLEKVGEFQSVLAKICTQKPE